MNNSETIPIQKITVIILAGGYAQRMGEQDKGMLQLLVKPMIEVVIEVLRAQTGQVTTSDNRNLESYQQYDIPVVPDIRKVLRRN